MQEPEGKKNVHFMQQNFITVSELLLPYKVKIYI